MRWMLREGKLEYILIRKNIHFFCSAALFDSYLWMASFQEVTIIVRLSSCCVENKWHMSG